MKAETSNQDLDSLLRFLSENKSAQNEDHHKLFRIAIPKDAAALNSLIKSEKGLTIHDQIESQIWDLIKLENPSKEFDRSEQKKLIQNRIGAESLHRYGTWVFYPWRKSLVHILDEEEFKKVRTIRNQYKITPEDQAILCSKKIGIIGLSVGQSAALTIALERIAGEIRIADFDVLELSNMNRIRTSLQNLGLSKSQIVQREIAEIDPYIKVISYPEGISESNIKSFLTDPVPLDLCIEECDSIEIKILVREHCKRLRIPVVMETSDKGMIDVERFDLDPNYPMLHGLVDPKVSFDFLKSLKSSKDKLPYLAPFAGIDTLSPKMKASAIELGETITTWPQLATDVILGGAIVGHCSREILLNGNINSGRNWVDLHSILEESNAIKNNQSNFEDETALALQDLESYLPKSIDFVESFVDGKTSELILEKAILAPSPGNSQKWKWLLKKQNLFLFLDKKTCVSVGDNNNIASLIGLGAAIENIVIASESNGLRCQIVTFSKNEHPLVAQIGFKPKQESIESKSLLYDQIEKRRTNRFVQNILSKAEDRIPFYLSDISSYTNVQVDFVTSKNTIKEIGELCCEADKIRILNTRAHFEFFQRELRWSHSDLLKFRDGISLSEIELSPSDLIGLKLASDPMATNHLKKIKGGKAFRNISAGAFEHCDALGFISLKKENQSEILNAGRVLERIWLNCTFDQIAFQPITYLLMFFSLLDNDVHHFLSDTESKLISDLRTRYLELLPNQINNLPVFLFRLHGADPLLEKTTRIPLSEKLITK